MTGRIKKDEPTGARLPILGYIRIGEKALNKNGKEYPTSLDYFKATGSKGLPGKYDKYFSDAYGEKPNKIQIMFISDNFKDVCDEHYEVRDNAGRLYAEGDGQNWKCFNQEKDLYEYGIKAELQEIENKYKAVATTSLTLRFILLKVPGVFGQWQFTTKGKASSIPAIRDTFDQVQQMAGTVVNIPFDLIVEKVSSQKPGSKSTFSVVSLIPNLSSQNMEVLAEYVESGNKRIRGLLTDERVEQLKSNRFELPENKPLALPEPEMTVIVEAKEVEKDTINKEQQGILHKLAKEIGMKQEDWYDYLRSKGLENSSSIKAIHFEVIKTEIESRLAIYELKTFRESGEVKPLTNS